MRENHKSQKTSCSLLKITFRPVTLLQVALFWLGMKPVRNLANAKGAFLSVHLKTLQHHEDRLPDNTSGCVVTPALEASDISTEQMGVFP